MVNDPAAGVTLHLTGIGPANESAAGIAATCVQIMSDKGSIPREGYHEFMGALGKWNAMREASASIGRDMSTQISGNPHPVGDINGTRHAPVDIHNRGTGGRGA